MKIIEQKINYQLNKYPAVKRVIKYAYQLGMYAISPKIKSEGNIVRISPDEKGEYFFGYYDKSPWDAGMRYVICSYYSYMECTTRMHGSVVGT